jgi:hypothetical protein
MNKYVILGLVIVVIVLLAFQPVQLFQKYYLTSCVASGPEKQDDFEMYLEEIDFEEYSATIKKFGTDFDVKVIKDVTYKNRTYSIQQIDQVNESSQKRLLIFAATHGNEFASALVIPELLSEIGKNNIFQSWNIRIITPINPIGLDYQSRYNEDGCDINRDFKNFQTVGAQIQRDTISEFDPNLIISLHEGPQKGFFVIGTSSVSRKIEESIITSLEEKQITMASKNFFGIPLVRRGLMHEGPIINIAKEIFRINTLGRYGESQGVGVITTESSWFETDVKKRVKPHIITIETVLREY